MANTAVHLTASTTAASTDLDQPAGTALFVSNRSATIGQAIFFRVYPKAAHASLKPAAVVGADENFVVEPGGTIELGIAGPVTISYVAASGTPAVSVQSIP